MSCGGLRMKRIVIVLALLSRKIGKAPLVAVLFFGVTLFPAETFQPEESRSCLQSPTSASDPAAGTGWENKLKPRTHETRHRHNRAARRIIFSSGDASNCMQ